MLKQIIDSISENVSLTIDLSIKEEEVTMMVNFKPETKDPAYKNLKPIIIRGTGEEVEKDFTEFLKSPVVADLANTVSTVAEFEKSVAEAKKNDSMVAEKKKKAKANEDKITKLLKKADECLSKDDLDGASKVSTQISKIEGADENKKYSAFCAKLATQKSKQSQVSLLDQIDDETKVTGFSSKSIITPNDSFDDERIEAIKEENFQKLNNKKDDTDLTEDF